MSDSFSLVMVSAMYENGGNVMHRLLDGHPELFVYPFESQLGTKYVNDLLVSLFPMKYRWPAFPLSGTAGDDYQSIIDEECKVRSRTPEVSKFRHREFDFSDDERRRRYEELVGADGRSRATNVRAFFRATFDVWKNRKTSGSERIYVGYSPIVVVDTEKILSDFKQAHVVHVVRNPWSAYADTKRRAVPLELGAYMTCWVMTQYYADLYRRKFPTRVHIVRFEDIARERSSVIDSLCSTLGIAKSASLERPTWNGQLLDEVYPWGTIRKISEDANMEAARELSAAERDEIRLRAGACLEMFDYVGIMNR